MTLPVWIVYGLLKRWMERELLANKSRAPWVHAGDHAQRLLEASPRRWRIYKAGIAAGRPSEFQKPREIRIERDRLWQEIERRGRDRVAQSERPLTLRNAVCDVVRTPEGQAMYGAYVKAARR